MLIKNKLKFSSKNSILGIFAHPDDESFSAGGLFSLSLKMGSSVYILTLTSGEKGRNDSNISIKNLKAKREEELKKACKIMGISLEKIFLEDLTDGNLKKNWDAVFNSIKNKISQIKPNIVVGIHPKSTNHLDHKTIGEILIQLKTKTNTNFSLYLQFLPNKYTPQQNEKIFILKLKKEIFEKKKKAILQHHSQKPDIDRILPHLQKKEYFIIFR